MQPTISATEYERRRALARKLLTMEPENPRRLAALRALLTREHIHIAAQKGILIVGHHAGEAQLQTLADHLRSLGLPTWLEMTGNQSRLSSRIVAVGLLILMICQHTRTDSDLQHCYGLAMTLGKVVLPIARHDVALPNLFFDLEPLYWGHNSAALFQELTQLLNASPV